MGIYDREYIREDAEGNWLSQRTMVTLLILVNVACFVANMLLGDSLGGKPLWQWMALDSQSLAKPWLWWQLLTYGFAHDPENIGHIAFNMFGLWMFGREIEPIYGRWEFLRIYLAMIVFSGLVFAGIALATGPSAVIGASGAVMGVTMLFVLHFPRRTLLFFGIVPMPAWAFGAIFIGADVLGVFNPNRDPGAVKTAHVAHLAGVGFALLYHQLHWNLGRLFPAGLSRKLRPTLRVHDPADDAEPEQRDLGKVVDEILAKITREGEASLTKKERQTLEDASRRYQRRRS